MIVGTAPELPLAPGADPLPETPAGPAAEPAATCPDPLAAPPELELAAAHPVARRVMVIRAAAGSAARVRRFDMVSASIPADFPEDDAGRLQRCTAATTPKARKPSRQAPRASPLRRLSLLGRSSPLMFV